MTIFAFRVRNKWFAMVDEGKIDWDDKELKEIFRSILMTTCDIGAITKPWDVSRKVHMVNSTICLMASQFIVA